MDTGLNLKKQNPWVNTVIIMLLVFLTWTLTILAKNNSQVVEKVYSSSIYPYISKGLGKIVGIVPISLFELFIMMIMIVNAVFLVIAIVKPKIILARIKYILHFICRVVGILYILFYFLWGFNYYREDYMNLAGMEYKPATIKELGELTYDIIVKMNSIRDTLEEDEDGQLLLDDSFYELSEQAQVGFDNFQIEGIDLSGKYAYAKPIFLSKWMSYTGITGIYFPYTTEPNVNTDIPKAIMPATICHEIGHQRGFAKEEEANFIAYKASVNNPDQRFQYSGYYLAFQYLMGEIYKVEQNLYDFLYSIASDGIKRDMQASYDYWKIKEGKTEKVMTTMNDHYLKVNNQQEGVRSYNGVVNLLLAEYRSK